MSTEIGVITGRHEVPQTKTKTSEYVLDMLFLTRFSGSKGSMLQMTFRSGGHIQLSDDEVETLRLILDEWKSLGEI